MEQPGTLSQEGIWEPGPPFWALDGWALSTHRTRGPQDLQLFREAGGWDVVSAVAEFWCSRVEWSSREKQYHLRGEVVPGAWSGGGTAGAPCTEHCLDLCPGVMPPDEYHSGVNNSTYTNVLVQTRSGTSPAHPSKQGQPEVLRLQPVPSTACALQLVSPRTCVCPSLTSGCWWLIRSRCPLTRSGTSTLSLTGTSLVSGHCIRPRALLPVPEPMHPP